jgi:hypothetical protein
LSGVLWGFSAVDYERPSSWCSSAAFDEKVADGNRCGGSP